MIRTSRGWARRRAAGATRRVCMPSVQPSLRRVADFARTGEVAADADARACGMRFDRG
jgi:para-nitrobenzyl esterase